MLNSCKKETMAKNSNSITGAAVGVAGIFGFGFGFLTSGLSGLMAGSFFFFCKTSSSSFLLRICSRCNLRAQHTATFYVNEFLSKKNHSWQRYSNIILIPIEGRLNNEYFIEHANKQTLCRAPPSQLSHNKHTDCTRSVGR